MKSDFRWIVARTFFLACAIAQSAPASDGHDIILFTDHQFKGDSTAWNRAHHDLRLVRSTPPEAQRRYLKLPPQASRRHTYRPATKTFVPVAEFEASDYTVTLQVGIVGKGEKGVFQDSVSSIVVNAGTWEVYDEISFAGPALRLGPGMYDLSGHPMNDRISSFKRIDIPVVQVFTDNHCNGHSFTSHTNLTDLRPLSGLQDTISSIRVHAGKWTFYEHVNYGGRHWTVGPGTYDLWGHFLNDQISSIKVVPEPSAVEVPAPSTLKEPRDPSRSK